jgi:hypothetical protein
MNNMKKQVLPILLALIMILAPTTVAFAAGGPGSLGGAADITAFKIDTNPGGATPSYVTVKPDSSLNINITVPYDFYQDNKDSITPEIDTADNVTSIQVASGGPIYNESGWTSTLTNIDFSKPIRFKVVNTSNETEYFVVTVSPTKPSDTNDMLSIKLTKAGGTAADTVTVTPSSTDVSISMPYGTNLSTLTAAIQHNGVKLEKSVYDGASWPSFTAVATPTEVVNFTGLVKYRVYAQNVDLKPTQYKEYTIAVSTSPAKTTNNITKLSVGTAVGVIDQTEKTVDVTVQNTTSLVGLNAASLDVEHNGASWELTTGFSLNAAETVAMGQITVTSENGLTRVYDVTVTKEDPTKTNSILSFVINDVAGTIAESTGKNTAQNPATIKVALPYNADLTDLTTVIKHNGAEIDPDELTSYTIGTPVDFTVTSQNEVEKFYKLTVTLVDPTTVKTIDSFIINDVEGIIGEDTVTVTLPYGSSVVALDPTIEYTGKSISPNPETTPPLSFTNPQKYTVTAQNGSTKIYTVTVIVAAPKTTKDITYFSIGDAVGTITGTDIAVTVPFGTDVTKLIPAIDHNGISVGPTGAQNFTAPVKYTVTAEDKSTQVYTATVTVDKQPAPPAKIGWDHSTGVWKYYNADGSAKVGWFYDSSYKAWFYFTASGNMVSGKWLHDTDGSWYYLSGNGKMVTGKQTIGGKAYSFKGNGVWIA